ncbi:MAG: hypothetical protein HY801_11380 [Candidatus Lindowbacteria bacterium]|nr:hypothetical protein [Candidatus Lindowbacteria bacterium]
MAEYLKQAPMPDHVTAKFWGAAREHRLLVQRCRDCREHQFFPQSYCRRCLSQKLDWV